MNGLVKGLVIGLIAAFVFVFGLIVLNGVML